MKKKNKLKMSYGTLYRDKLDKLCRQRRLGKISHKLGKIGKQKK